MIYHITTRQAWREAQRAGVYTDLSLAQAGFIHCSTEEQVFATGQRHFNGQTGLVLLALDPARLVSEIRYEEGQPGQLFPHVYGPINPEAVVSLYAFTPGTALAEIFAHPERPA